MHKRKMINTVLLGAISAWTLLACVTINIYFPAEEVREAADKIVQEVWGEKEGKSPADKVSEKLGLLLQLIGPANAYAEQDINITTPKIRAIKASIKERSGDLKPFLGSGNVGIGADGLLVVRNTQGLKLKAKAEVNKLVNAENQDRDKLYSEIAKANGFPNKVGEVKSIFADSWREQAERGWFLQSADGSWKKK